MAALVVACDGERLRPGPPSLVLEGPPDGQVFPPDTLAVAVRAADANGLDSITVGYLGDITVIDAYAHTSFEDFVFVRLPAGLSPGQVVTITGVAVDLSGLETRATLALTVGTP